MTSIRTTIAHMVGKFSIAGLYLGACLHTPTVFAGEVTVVELFTSQGCYSCPAADELLGELIAADPQLIGLEFHVDYWNTLVHGSDGSWQDPFSSKQFTDRQRLYRTKNLRGREGVYTPQAVVNGSYATVGSSRSSLTREINRSASLPVSVSLQRDDGQLNIAITGNQEGAEAMLVHFLKHTRTEITGGENNQLVMENYNVVTDMQALGTLNVGSESKFKVAVPVSDNQGCAVLVQAPAQGAILGAASCP